MVLHEAESYRSYRPDYPPELFARLREELAGRAPVVDLGAGTGLSLASMIRAGITGPFIAVEPDSAMLQAARGSLGNNAPCEWHLASAENTGLATGSAAAVTIASAYHWMKRPEVDDEILRICAPNGCVQIFEYQFPKAPSLPALNEWVRRRFNEIWRLDVQKPRGSLRELCAGLLARERVLGSQDLCNTPETATMSRALSLDELVGLIFSQARALRYLKRLADDGARLRHRVETRASLSPFYAGADRIEFRFKLAGLLIRLR